MSILKRLLLASTLLFGGVVSSFPQPFELKVNDFCGINDSLSTTKIKTCASPDAENVLTDRGVLETMFGMETVVDAVLDGFPVKNVWEFISSDGSEYLVFHSSESIYQTNLSGTPVKIGTATAAADVDAVVAFDKIFFVDGSQALWYWDGTSSGSVSGAPLAEFIEFHQERIALGNTSTSGSEVHLSSGGGFSFWTVPVDVSEQPQAPNSFRFKEDDGESITALFSAPWGLVVGKKHSSWMLKGLDNETFYKRQIAGDIGFVDDRIVRLVDGRMVWLSFDGVYAWSGVGRPEYISKDIEERVKKIRQVTSQADSWTVNTQAEWEQGTAATNGPLGSWDTKTVPGVIFPSSVTITWTAGIDFSTATGTNISTTTRPGDVEVSISTGLIHEGDFISNSSWTETAGGAGTTVDSANSDSNCPATAGGTPCGYLLDNNTTPNGCQAYVDLLDVNENFLASKCIIDLGAGTGSNSGFEFTWENRDLATTTSVYYRIGLGAAGGGGSPRLRSSATANGFWLVMQASYERSVGFFWLRVDDIKISSYPASGVIDLPFDTNMSTPTFGHTTINFTSDTIAGLTFQSLSSSDDSSYDSPVDFSPGDRPESESKRYVKYRANFNTKSGTVTARIQSFEGGAVSTGSYYSQVHFLGTDQTSWDTGDFSETSIPGGLVTYEVRGDTIAFTDLSSTPSWVAHTNHTNINLSTSSYYQFRIISAVTSTTDTLRISRQVANWKEGEAPSGASIVDDHRFIMCVAISSSATQNDSCEIFQKNGYWTRLTGPEISGMAKFNEAPIAVDGSTNSAVWKIMREGVNNFAGTPIISYWETPDFNLGEPIRDKTVHEIWIEAQDSPGDDMEVLYAVDRETTTVSATVDLGERNDYIIKRVPISDGFIRGKYHRFKVKNSDLDESYKIESLTIKGNVEKSFQ